MKELKRPYLYVSIISLILTLKSFLYTCKTLYHRTFLEELRDANLVLFFGLNADRTSGTIDFIKSTSKSYARIVTMPSRGRNNVPKRSESRTRSKGRGISGCENTLSIRVFSNAEVYEKEEGEK